MSTQNTDAPQTAADLFGCAAVGSSRTRFKLSGASVRSRAGGIVSAGVLASGKDDTGLLVHTDIPGRQEQSMDLGAVASGIVMEAIPYHLLVKAFAEESKLADLEKAIAAYKRQHA